MSAEKNIATIRTWVDQAWNAGNVESQRGSFSPRYQWDELPGPFGAGFNGLKQFVEAFRAAFPDLNFAIEEVVADESTVVWRCVGTGTQEHEFMGIPATGKSIKVPAIIMTRFEDGLIREDHVCWDQFGMMMQLGVIQLPEPATA